MHERLKLFSLRFSFNTRAWEIVIITCKCLLSILMAKNHFVLINILNLSILRNTLFIIRVIFLNCLNYSINTCGKNGEIIFLCYNFSQFTFLKKGWNFTYSMPAVPSLFYGFLWIKELIKSTLSRLHPNGGISSILTCLANIFYLISLRFAPT